MEVFQPVPQEEEYSYGVDSHPVPAQTGQPTNHTPLNGSKLGNYVAYTDIEAEQQPFLVAGDDLLKSPTRRRQAGPSAEPQSQCFVFKQPEPIVKDESEPVKLNGITGLVSALEATTTTFSETRHTTTPIMLGKVRQIDIPSSLEKFKSLKIGLDSLNQSMQQSQAASPIKPNPFSPKPAEAVPPLQMSSKADLKAMIEESLAEFKTSIRNDIQNLHVEIIKQSLTQQSEMRLVMEEYLPAVKDILEELRVLRDENERLRLRLFGT